MGETFTKVQHRAIQYWFLDGLAEISAGLICFLLVALFVLWQLIPLTRWSLFIFFIPAFAVSFGLRLLIQKIKERTTYPRTGYVAPFSGMENKRALVMMIVFTIVLLAVNFYLTTQGETALLWSPGVAGLTFAFVFAWTGYLTALRRFYFTAFFSLFVGAALVFLEIGYFSGVAILTGLTGVILLFSGIQARRAYFRLNPPSNE